MPFSFESTPGQLPKTIFPFNYQIRLQPDLDKLITHGSMTVDIVVLKPVTEIVLNALDLDITNATLTVEEKKIPLRPSINAARQTLLLPLSEELHPGKYRLTWNFPAKSAIRRRDCFM